MNFVHFELKPSQDAHGLSLFQETSTAERVHVETFGDGSSTYFFDRKDNGRIVALIHWGLCDGEDAIIVLGNNPMHDSKSLLDYHSNIEATIDFTSGERDGWMWRSVADGYDICESLGDVSILQAPHAKACARVRRGAFGTLIDINSSVFSDEFLVQALVARELIERRNDFSS